MRAHNDSAALAFGPEQIFGSGTLPADAMRLRNRCLRPGLYARHLEAWLDHFPMRQFLFVDGIALREDPAPLMDELTARLGLSPVDYQRLLRFDPVKGFFCVHTSHSRKCLGSGKGRKYSPMSAETRQLLNRQFEKPNAALRVLLSHYSIRLPYFLLADV